MIDPSGLAAVLPAVDHPQEGGLGWDDLDIVAVTALAAGPVGWDVTIYDADLDPDGIQPRRIVRFIEIAARRAHRWRDLAVQGGRWTTALTQATKRSTRTPAS